MPDLNSIPVPQYEPNQPYHWEYDNLPLQALAARDEMINAEVDSTSKILRDCNGTQGTLANRLNQSIDEDGNLKVAAIDSELHNIAAHTDGSIDEVPSLITYYNTLNTGTVISTPVTYVRMLEAERAKLQSIDLNATSLNLAVETPSNVVHLNQGTVSIVNSTTVHWEYEDPNKISAVLQISTDFAHGHHYNITPILLTGSTYKVNSYATDYMSGSLRVAINGIRLNPNTPVYYPNFDNAPNINWTLISYTEDSANGKFTLSSALGIYDVIQVDFDQSLT